MLEQPMNGYDIVRGCSLSLSPFSLSFSLCTHTHTHTQNITQGLGIMPASPVMYLRAESDFLKVLKPGFYCPPFARTKVWEFVEWGKGSRIGMLGQSSTRRSVPITTQRLSQ
jgi:hypothetical protein